MSSRPVFASRAALGDRTALDGDPVLTGCSPPPQAVAELLATVPGAPSVDVFNKASTPLARMHNWSQLVPALVSCGLDVNAEQRARIVGGGASPFPKQQLSAAPWSQAALQAAPCAWQAARGAGRGSQTCCERSPDVRRRGRPSARGLPPCVSTA